MGKSAGRLEKSIFKATFLVLVAHQLFKLAGLIQSRVMGQLLPRDHYDVVYVFAFENCIFLLFLIGTESLNPAFLPVFAREVNLRGEKSAWAFANTLLTVQFIGLLILAALLAIFPGGVVGLLTQWSHAVAPEKYKMASESVRMLAPALVGLSLGATTYMLLNSYKRFFLAAFGDAVWKFCVVGLLLVGSLLSQDAIRMLIWGLVAGSFCKVLTHLVGLRDKIKNFRPALDFSHPAFKGLLLLMLPLLAGVFVAKLRDQINQVYLLSSLDRSGLMQANSMGRKLQSALLYLVPYTLSVAAFPYFCDLASKGDTAALGGLVTRFGRMLLALFTPVAVFVAVAAVPLTALVYQGGYFDGLAVQRTAVALTCYTFVLPAAAIESMVMQAFFASRRMVAVTVIGIVFSFLSMLISWGGIRWFGSRDLVVLAFIAGGFTLTRSLKCLTLVAMLKRHAQVFPIRESMGFALRVALAAGLAAGGGWLALHRLSALADTSATPRTLLALASSGALFGVIYLVAAYVLRIDEIRETMVLIGDKVKTRH